jgi:hypothetical protein
MFGLLVLVGLFVALTPGILFRLKGSKNVSAAMHAVLFGLVSYVVSVYFMSYDGFQTGPTPICPGGGVFVTGTKQCSIPIQCPDSYTFNGKECASTPISCPAPYILTNGECIAPVEEDPEVRRLLKHKIKPIIHDVGRNKPRAVPRAVAASYPSSITDKNGNTISVGSIASCTGVKGTFDITVTAIESKPSSTIVRGTENGNSRAYKLSSCVAASGGESTSIFD